ncbi:hypothetical protein [Haemophilus haemolyticus]|uniref:hypothetical protein n=1 Tax=Haemophilus haemolyticus TaxID=726 RepID=UPI0010665E28|nr:hypothetical protein [Haemophilus haemolyticus]
MSEFIDLHTRAELRNEDSYMTVFMTCDENGDPELDFGIGFSLNANELAKFHEWIGDWLRGAGKIEE